MKLELHGLEIFGRHGVLPNEKRDGQMFLYDVELEVDEPAADDIDARGRLPPDRRRRRRTSPTPARST